MTSIRSLTLTEELEKLEQSITLTLQEIDRNFSKSYRIVTTSILPVIETYGEHSAAAWQSSKFWKQFFESSANVSLSGYEELMNEQSGGSVTGVTSENESSATTEYHDSGDGSISYVKEEGSVDSGSNQAISGAHSLMQVGDSLLDDGEVSGSTPRPLRQPPARPRVSSHESPYETMRREMRAEEAGMEEDAESNVDDGETEQDDSTVIFEQRTQRLRDITSTPLVIAHSGRDEEPWTGQRQRDPLLHRVLDKTYRLHTTHHKPQTRPSPLKSGPSNQARRELWRDSPMSSPEMAVPKFRSEAFLSPLRNTAARAKLAHALSEPRTPGVSVQTSMAKRKFVSIPESENDGDIKLQNPVSGQGALYHNVDFDSENDDTEFYGMSPPKTIQFAFPPSKLTQTPAREASKKIVESILFTAGAQHDTSEERSPTLAKLNQDLLDDSF